jgi:hypothetical protein
MMGTFDFYIDKRKYNKIDKHIDIKLDYPIEIKDYEYLKVKLVDFKFLNNIYNISKNLMNNQFNIRSYSKTYQYFIQYIMNILMMVFIMLAGLMLLLQGVLLLLQMILMQILQHYQQLKKIILMYIIAT